MYEHRSDMLYVPRRCHECVNKFECTDVVEELSARNRGDMEDCYQKTRANKVPSTHASERDVLPSSTLCMWKCGDRQARNPWRDQQVHIPRPKLRSSWLLAPSKGVNNNKGGGNVLSARAQGEGS
jgi:hypothetical protein